MTDETTEALLPSRIRYVSNMHDQQQQQGQQQQRRQGHLMSLLPLSRRDGATGERTVQDFRVYVELSAFLAFKHIQRHSTTNTILPHLTERLALCEGSFEWTYRHHDTQFSPLQAARALLSYDINLASDTGNTSSVGGATNSNSDTPMPAENGYWDISSPQQEGIIAMPSSTLPPATLNDYWSIPATTAPAPAPVNYNDYWSTPAPDVSEYWTIPVVSTSNPPTQTPVNSNSNNGWDITLIAPPTTPQTARPQRTAAPYRTNVPLTVPPLTLPPRGKPDQEQQQRPLQTQKPPARRKRQLQQQSQQQQQAPFAVLGAARSAVSQAVSILGGAFELPQISSSSTASTLDHSPFFARTVPTNEGDAHASIIYLSQELQVTHVGVLFINDSWGRRYEQDLQKYAHQYGMTLKSVPYKESSDEELNRAMVQLQQTNLRYFIGIINPSAWKPVVKKAHEFGLMGHTEYTWLIGDLVELVGDGFALDRATESDLALALHGTGVVFLQVTPHAEFDRALAAVANDPDLQQEFIASHSEPQLLENFTFSSSPGRSLFQYLTYDAVMALGITACETPGLFTGKEFYEQLLTVDFEGVSGRVLLHETTGTRLGDSLQYQIVNLVRDDFLNPAHSSSTGTITFAADITSLIQLSPQSATNTSVSSSKPMIQAVQPFVYFDNGTVPPLGLPFLEGELNLIPNGVLYTGLAMGIIVMLLSLAFGVWTFLQRNTYVVRASQPVFLIQLCVGTFIVAATIVPLGWQEPKPGLDAACMSLPWLFCVGFTCAISALFSKARRINELMNSGTGFRRIQVKPQDVMRQCIILMSINVAILTAWSASPWRLSWHRIAVDNNVDEFGRSVESYGVCRADSPWHFVLSVPLVLCNVVVLVMATYQSYRARDLPVELSETLYLSISLLSLSEIFLLGIAVMFAVLSQPTAFYLVSCLVLCLGCLAFLLPVFLPKYWQRNQKAPRGRMSTSVIDRRGTNTRGFQSGLTGLGGSALSALSGGSAMSLSSPNRQSRVKANITASSRRLGSSKPLAFGSKHGSSNALSSGSKHSAHP